MPVLLPFSSSTFLGVVASVGPDLLLLLLNVRSVVNEISVVFARS